MYLSKLKLWNFRKFGSDTDELNLEIPDLEIDFKEGLNVLIGENDSGKTAIIDSIKIILNTHSSEWIRLEREDFYKTSKRLRIECYFEDLLENEASNFTEWLGLTQDGDKSFPYLKIFLDVKKDINDRILSFDVRAGASEDGYRLPAEAREYLKTTYLKPLRDAKNELIPKRNSRLSQILQGHEVFKGKDEEHELVDIFKKFSHEIKDYFRNNDKEGSKVKKSLDIFLEELFGDKRDSEFNITDQKLRNILEILELTLEDGKLGLGSHNLLFIASELLNLERKDSSIKLALIEELEAHLHPQAQLRAIEYMRDKKGIQFILTTHSPNIGSKVKLENLIICEDNGVFAMGKNNTKLGELDYRFLERFLDVTKANLFFAKGLILVEGWSEEMIIPVLAERIGIDLTKKGISIVNVASIAFLRYSRIFQRNQMPIMSLPVSIVTDVDIKPEQEEEAILSAAIIKKENKFNGQTIKTFVSPHWTFEYCLGLSPVLAPYLFKSVKLALDDMRVDGTNNRAAITRSFPTDLNREDVARFIYKALIIDKEISKVIIAQHFAEILKENELISKEALEAEDSIKYIIEAIKYAAGEN
jgi:putative ATP-dependent endonuclease of the OLD family